MGNTASGRFGDDIPGMEGLGTDITVVCPWEAFGDMELKHNVIIRFGDDIPGMEGLCTDITVLCLWETFVDMELSDLAKYGMV
ncbi:hypothetical protein NHX12_018150 [Muraenolepis orangiensis]|uniref:Retinal cone rhodopsin-sensitive cGMP 3',5'-cyclic phosphodiesterase subunit gamma n=1 Tax=Muraenolepis orangiensis TaxID=630683 RepID=A0A9Q0IYC8_9TELE|nr:hypothetical protein NHX12_018150 [Muraenolepis orangiensis]